MKKTKEKIDNTNINNSYKETIGTTLEDGFVKDEEIGPIKCNNTEKVIINIIRVL